MFQNSFVDGDLTGRPWSFTASFIFQCGLVAVTLVIPLLNTAELPAASWVSQILAPAPPPGPPAAPPPVQNAAPTHRPARQFDGKLLQPPKIPNKVALIEETEVADWAPPAPVISGAAPCPNCKGPGIAGAFASAGPDLPLPAPPKVVKRPEVAVPDTPVRVVSVVQAAKLVHKVIPIYPEIAKRAGISGVVEIEAIIAKDGAMQSLQVVRGHPLLINAAVDAVKQWRYRPTLLQGQAVEVITRIEVNFTLR